jgi:hypothetical protein
MRKTHAFLKILPPQKKPCEKHMHFLEIGFPAASKKHMRKIHVFLKIKAGEN